MLDPRAGTGVEEAGGASPPPSGSSRVSHSKCRWQFERRCNLVEKTRALTRKGLLCNLIQPICFLRQSLVWSQRFCFAFIMEAALPERCWGCGNKTCKRMAPKKFPACLWTTYGACVRWDAAQLLKMVQSKKYDTESYLRYRVELKMQATLYYVQWGSTLVNFYCTLTGNKYKKMP